VISSHFGDDAFTRKVFKKYLLSDHLGSLLKPLRENLLTKPSNKLLQSKNVANLKFNFTISEFIDLEHYNQFRTFMEVENLWHSEGRPFHARE
jgi:hypothetical protein